MPGKAYTGVTCSLTTVREEADNTARLEYHLNDRGFALHDVAQDGHCQFHALAHQLITRFPGEYADCEPSYREVRRAVADWLREHRHELEPYAYDVQFPDWESLCEAVEDAHQSDDPLWGDGLTLLAMETTTQR